jgi:hypothetical protein
MGTFTSSGRGGRVRFGSALLLALSMFWAGGFCAAQTSGSDSREPQYTAFEVRPADQIDTADAAALKAKHHDLVAEAAFWGYDLNSGHWVADQVVCPEIPDAVVLHYRRPGAKGESLFTAIVPRGSGRVLVVPVLYSGSTPFESAFGAKRTMSVFNQAVPAEVAKRDAGPDGHWLQLAMTYAVIAGAEPRVPRQPEQQTGLMQAPDPMFKGMGTANEVIFSDRQAPRKYTIWTIDLNAQGRATTAGIRVISDFEAPQTAASQPEAPQTATLPAEEPQAASSQTANSSHAKPEKAKKPKQKKANEPEEPKVRVVQDAPDPTPKPAPQQ